MAPAQTHARILGVAEKLFAEHGYDGTTMRHITREAGVNLAAVNYYLGDKESLYLEVLRRRLQPLNQNRLARLAEAERAAAGRPVPLPELIELLAGPLFALHLDLDGGPPAARLIGRSMSEPLPFMEKVLAEEMQPVLARFAQSIRRHTPALPPADFLWRFSFVIGAMQHSLASLHRMSALTRGLCRDDDHAGALARFVPFAVRALQAGESGSDPGAIG
jgi:AcrR family transcriptional regulator